MLSILSKLKEVSVTRSRRAADPGRSRTMSPRAPSGPVKEAMVTRRDRVQRRAMAQLGYELSQQVAWATLRAMRAVTSRARAAWARFRHPLTGGLRRVPREAVWGHGVRARRRYLGLVGLFYVLWAPTVPTVPLSRSGAAAGAGRTVAQILVPLKGTSEGRGLINKYKTRGSLCTSHSYITVRKSTNG